MAIVTIFALISWWVTPADGWLPKAKLTHFLAATEERPQDAADERM
jgi:hypothetical protein